jgi:hypothetical protein
MTKAGQFAVNNASREGHLSYSSAGTLGERWTHFASFAKENGVRWLEDVNRALVTQYAESLACRVSAHEMSAAYAQNRVSAVNSVMKFASRGRWESVSPTRDGGIEKRSAIRKEAPGGYDRDRYRSAIDAMRESGFERAASVAELAREFGLRSKEGSLFDARAALKEARSHGRVTVEYGTKGGRERTIPITSPRQIAAIERAAALQTDRSVMPGDENWKHWRENELRAGREILKESTGGGYHDLRAAHACERYASITGKEAPVIGGARTADKASDHAARQQIAEELGHGRIDVTTEYLGSMR